jgi:hypothetical protein
MRLDERERSSAVPPTPVLAIAAGFQLPAVFEEAPVACQRGSNVKGLRPAGLHDGVTPIVGVTPDHDLDPSGGLARLDELGRQCSGLPERDAHDPALRLFDIQSDAPGAHLLAEDQDAARILVAPPRRGGRGVLHLGHRIQGLPSFRLLGIIEEPITGFSRLGVQSAEPLLGLLAQGGLGVPGLNEEDVMNTRPVGRGLQISRSVGDMAPTPHTGNGHDQQAEVDEVIPVNARCQGVNKVV